MATQKETVSFILEKLGNQKHFTTRAMFGEYALYADGITVALICDDQLYIKILPQSSELERICEKDTPYPGAKMHYVIPEDEIGQIEDLPLMLKSIAVALKAEKKKKGAKKRSKTKGGTKKSIQKRKTAKKK